MRSLQNERHISDTAVTKGPGFYAILSLLFKGQEERGYNCITVFVTFYNANLSSPTHSPTSGVSRYVQPKGRRRSAN